MINTTKTRYNVRRRAVHIGQTQKHAFLTDRAYRALAWRRA